jgi:hypothetical protein
MLGGTQFKQCPTIHKILSGIVVEYSCRLDVLAHNSLYTKVLPAFRCVVPISLAGDQVVVHGLAAFYDLDVRAGAEFRKYGARLLRFLGVHALSVKDGDKGGRVSG